MVVSANQLRGVQVGPSVQIIPSGTYGLQAEATLVMLMEKQLDVRRNQITALQR